ncbi:MAG: CDP-2,3-bis-(O-geranylgeranyl)-sn-glycerol synthase [Candidatus Altiarchaeota archaeon]|nr:CDP-2,3-bis-(O-geranylgeranyl)-sn-glycerol synthase [Candidatus Altiarchaeota archaeon]
MLPESTLAVIIGALWFILPAYAANSAPVDVSQIKSLKKYGKPIDGGLTWRGARILGDGKTWRGFFAGIIAGTLTGMLQSYLQPSLQESYPYLPDMSLQLAFMLSLGALVGDMAASFVKRRSGLRSGEPAMLLDQLDFVFGALFFAWLWNVIVQGRIGGVFEEMIGYRRFFIILIVTPVVHLVGNLIAWLWKLKKQPW